MVKQPYDIRDNFPETIHQVLDEEITILMPHLMEQILAAGEDEDGNSSPVR